MIANSGHDEKGKYRGGIAGDQTGKEFAIINWYNRPWTCVLRYPSKRVAKDLAYLARAAALNDAIGYDQGERVTFWAALSEAANYDTAKITKPCEADCTSGVATLVKAAGLRQGVAALAVIDPDYYWSGNMRPGFKAIGFHVLTEKRFLTSDSYLLPGDILLYEGHHAATNLDVGALVRDQWDDVPTYVIGWHRDDFGWWFADTVHSYVKSDWKLINHYWYYFNGDGYAVTGHHVINGKEYYFEAEPGHQKECALMKTDIAGVLSPWEVK